MDSDDDEESDDQNSVTIGGSENQNDMNDPGVSRNDESDTNPVSQLRTLGVTGRDES